MGSDFRAMVLRVVIVRTVVIPEGGHSKTSHVTTSVTTEVKLVL